MKYITSIDNKNVKEIKRLMKKKERLKLNKYVIEGEKLIEEAMRSSVESEKIFVSESYYKKNSDFVVEIDKENELYILKDASFEMIKTTETTQGILAVVKMPSNYSEEDIVKNKKFLLLLDNIQDPGNMGTIIRTADAFGVDVVLISGECVDVYNPKVVRATMGSIFRVPIYMFDGVSYLIPLLRENNIKVYAASLRGSDSITDIVFDKRIALIVGNESKGIREEVIDLADQLIKIPISEKTESLNVSVAAGILIYEIKRQFAKFHKL